MMIKSMILVIATSVSLGRIRQSTGYVEKLNPYNHPNNIIVYFDKEDALNYAFSQASIVKVRGEGSFQYFLDGRFYAGLQKVRDERTKEYFWKLKFKQSKSFRYPSSDLGEEKMIEKISESKPEFVEKIIRIDSKYGAGGNWLISHSNKELMAVTSYVMNKDRNKGDRNE